jgi:NADH:ubiquinone oxidoreductase subunit F (NADH-binding)/NADH:ubiquinone oxidoreductase subunit E
LNEKLPVLPDDGLHRFKRCSGGCTVRSWNRKKCHHFLFSARSTGEGDTMSSGTNLNPYGATLVPALQRIQQEFGYLKKEALERFSEESGVPQYRLQAVASFFPHFELSPPKKVVLRVCRDTTCHLAGSAAMLRELQSLAGGQVAVEGVSCVGRCDRAPAACVNVQGAGHEHYYLVRSTDGLREVVEACLRDAPPEPDHDADQGYSAKDWVIDPYCGNGPKYLGVRKAIAARDASLALSAEILREEFQWGSERVEEFRQGCIRQMRVDFSVETEVAEAVHCWQVEKDWAKGANLGGWADALLDELKDADLRGMGGAGIPATQKWRDVRDAVRKARERKALERKAREREEREAQEREAREWEAQERETRERETDERAFIVVNGDESEPATFKDRELLLRAPHTIVEGVILAGLITEATQGFIYIRHEYGEQIAACRAEIERAERLGFCGENATVLGRPFPISVFVSPGGYICGEQSALIEAMSDRRGEPRNMPPKLETNGLLDLPTLVSNAETFAWAPFIILRGGATYAALGVNGWKGRRFFSVSGDVKRPGVYEVPMGLTLRKLIDGEQYCGGIAGDRALKALAPSGPSGGFLPAKLSTAAFGNDKRKLKKWQTFASRHQIDPAAAEFDVLDLELELNLFRELSPTEMLGAGLVVYAEGRDMVEEAVNSLEFFRNESCGKCVPCRMGSQKLASLGTHLLGGKISADRWERELVPLVKEMGKAIGLASICGLGRSVPMPLLTVLNFFPADVASHLSAAAVQTKEGKP